VAADAMVRDLSGPDAAEGIDAFLEKRPARWPSARGGDLDGGDLDGGDQVGGNQVGGDQDSDVRRGSTGAAD
jgi:hypothetical protein